MLQPEPDDFDVKVRLRGKKYLNKLNSSAPTTRQWSEHDYWNEVRSYMYQVYEGILSYSAHWIPSSSNPNIDHFVPKSVDKNLAYEWSNYRLACAYANTLKKIFRIY